MSRPARVDGAPPQDVRFCRSADGTRIAYAVHGSGSAAAARGLLAQPPRVRLAEPGVAALPARPRTGRDRDPLRRARQRDVGLGRRRLRPAPPASPTSKPSPTPPGWTGSPWSACRRAGRWRVAYAARHPGAGQPRLILYGTLRRARRPDGPEAVELEQTFQQMIKVGLGAAGQHVPTRVHQPHDPGRDRGAGGLARRPAGPGDLDRERRARPAPDGCRSTSATCCPG